MQDSIVDMQGLAHSLGDNAILKGACLTIEPGEIVVLSGPSGSGKTTLLCLLGALRSVQEGSLRVLDYQLARNRIGDQQNLRRRIGYVFQHHNLLPYLTAEENVMLALPAVAPSQKRKRAQQALDDVGLADRRLHYPHELSGGQRQRVALARALVRRPPLILADEPTASLDARSGREAVALLQQLAKQQASAVLLVTHDDRLFEYADRVLLLNDGRVVQMNSTATVWRP